MIEAVGTSKEAPAVEAAIARGLSATRTVRDGLNADLLNEPEPLPELYRAMQMLHQRGYEMGSDLKGEAQAYVYFRWLAGQPGPRPPEWSKRFEAFRGDDSFAVREAALRSIPQAIPEDVVPAVMSGLTDRDPGVQRAACEVARKSGDAQFVKPLLHIIATGSHKWLLREATNAMYALKARYELYQAWVARMPEGAMLDYAFDALQSIVANHPFAGSRPGNVTESERLAIQKAWQTFLAKHEQELRDGKKFELGSVEITPDLYGRAQRFAMPDGKEWPPQTEPAAAER